MVIASDSVLCWLKPVGYRYYLKNGTVFAFEVPLGPHESAIGEFRGQMRESPVGKQVDDKGSLRCHGSRGGQAWAREPDGSYISRGYHRSGPDAPAANPDGNPWPTVIVEVANSQGLAELVEAVRDWLDPSTQVQTVIAIKLFTRRVDNTMAMLAMRFIRNALGTAAVPGKCPS